MSNLKEEVKKVHNSTEFKINFAGITRVGEFEYTHGGTVRPGLEYHIHYTYDKTEVYMLGGGHTSSSRVIKKIGGKKTQFSQYTDIKTVNRQKYPETTPAYPIDSDYRLGSFTRYFTQKANDPNSDIFEISEEDFNNENVLFRYVDFEWRLSGTRTEVIRDNTRTIDALSSVRGNEELRKKLLPLQFWQPPANSPDDLQKKLSLLKMT